ncbi:MAG: hypothetical protein WCR74_00095 [Betaproteobacteria bacterium]
MSAAALMAAAQARLALWADGLGHAGIIGIGLLIFAATWHVSAVVPAQDEMAVLQSRLARIEGGGPRELPPAQRAAVQLQEFYRHFPGVAEAPEWVQKIHKMATAEGLALETGEYRMARDGELGMSRYQITLPLKGGYPQVRRFIAKVLDEIPAATLDEVSMKRESVGAGGVETRVRFTLYLVEGR